jgi:sugar phosphate permease
MNECTTTVPWTSTASEILMDYGAMLRRPRVWGLMWVHVCCNFIYFISLAWTPYYLTHELHASLQLAAVLSTLPYIGMAGERALWSGFTPYAAPVA